MRIIVIPQKMSGSGTIRDVASADHDRLIAFKTGEKYAVLTADYFRVGYTTHRSEKAAIRAAVRLAGRGYPAVIMDYRGYTASIMHPYNDRCLTQDGAQIGEPSTST